MINDPYTFLNAVLQSKTAITSLLGHYQGTNIPLIKGGVLPEVETDLPCITFYTNSSDQMDNTDYTSFTVNCYAETERDSFLLARTVLKELQQHQETFGSYSATITGNILTSIPDPNANEVNTAVEIRLFKIGGAI